MDIVTHVTVRRGVNQEYVVIPEGVTHIGGLAFVEAYRREECKIKHVKLPSTLLDIGISAFAECQTLLSVDFSECIHLQRIGDRAFAMCRDLRHVSLSNCTSLSLLSTSAFRGCDKLVLHVPRHVQYFPRCFSNLKLVALQNYSDSATDMQTLLLPSSERSQRVSTLLRRENVNVIYADDWDLYADVFDAIGRLNVLWVESLRRQSAYRETNGWNKSVIVAESESKNYILELWRRVQPYDTQNMFAFSSDIVREGLRLVQMGSYQRQPEETKLFKEILEAYNVREPPRPRPPTSDGRSKRPRMANLRL